MKLLLSIVIAVLTTIAVSERPSIELEPMSWSTKSYLPGPYYQVVTSGDLLVYGDYSNLDGTGPNKRGIISPPGEGSVTAIRRRNTEGFYVPVGNITQSASFSANTNGKWVALHGEGSTLFRVDNNTISASSSVMTTGGYLLSDDTFVGWESDGGIYYFRTYQYEASNNTWNSIPAAELIVTTSVFIVGDISTYRATDTHLVFADTTNSSDVLVHIYSRQADKSWKLIDSVPVNSSFTPTVNYNGDDTLVISSFEVSDSETEAGIVFIYTNSSGQWTEHKFTTSSVGYRPVGYLGGVTTFLDANTLLVTAGLEGYTGSGVPAGGKVLVMTRNSSGLWEPAFDLVNPVTSGVFGLAVGVNDYDIIVPKLVVGSNPVDLTFYTAPRCFYQPINVTCADQQVSDCSQLDISSLYTVNNAQCGAVSSTLNGLGLVNNKAVQAQFSFSKTGGFVASCNATVTCPAPPVAVQSPSKVSGANVVEFGFVAVVLFSIAML